MDYLPVPALHPGLIGQIVIVQGFNRDGDEIKRDTLRKHVGILEAYRVDKTQDMISIKGLPPVTVFHERDYYEVYQVRKANL